MISKENNFSSNLELIIAYFKSLEEKNFFGTIELTLQGGKLAYTRELRSLQDFEIAAKCLPDLSEEAQDKILESFKNNSKFRAAMEKKKTKDY